MNLVYGGYFKNFCWKEKVKKGRERVEGRGREGKKRGRKEGREKRKIGKKGRKKDREKGRKERWRERGNGISRVIFISLLVFKGLFVVYLFLYF